MAGLTSGGKKIGRVFVLAIILLILFVLYYSGTKDDIERTLQEKRIEKVNNQ